MEVTRAAEASSAVQTVLETEIGEHEALKSAARAAYEALVVEGGSVRQLPWEPSNCAERSSA